MGAPTPVQSSSGVCVLHRLRSVKEGASRFELRENAAFPAALALVDMVPDRVPQRPLRGATSVTLLSTQPHFGRRHDFQVFIQCGELSRTLARTSPKQTVCVRPAWPYGPFGSAPQLPASRAPPRSALLCRFSRLRMPQASTLSSPRRRCALCRELSRGAKVRPSILDEMRTRAPPGGHLRAHGGSVPAAVMCRRCVRGCARDPTVT